LTLSIRTETLFEQLTEVNHDQWVAKTGTAKDVTHLDGYNNFVDGAMVSASGRGTTTRVRAFGCSHGRNLRLEFATGKLTIPFTGISRRFTWLRKIKALQRIPAIRYPI